MLWHRPSTCNSTQPSLSLLTSLSSLLCRLDAGQAHILGLILYKQHTNEWEACTEDARHGQDSPPVVVVQEHRDQDRTQTPSQVHTAGQHRPPCSKLGGFKPLMEKRQGTNPAENSHLQDPTVQSWNNRHILPSLGLLGLEQTRTWPLNPGLFDQCPWWCHSPLSTK